MVRILRSLIYSAPYIVPNLTSCYLQVSGMCDIDIQPAGWSDFLFIASGSGFQATLATPTVCCIQACNCHSSVRNTSGSLKIQPAVLQGTFNLALISILCGEVHGWKQRLFSCTFWYHVAWARRGLFWFIFWCPTPQLSATIALHRFFLYFCEVLLYTEYSRYTGGAWTVTFIKHKNNMARRTYIGIPFQLHVVEASYFAIQTKF